MVLGRFRFWTYLEKTHAERMERTAIARKDAALNWGNVFKRTAERQAMKVPGPICRQAYLDEVNALAPKVSERSERLGKNGIVKLITRVIRRKLNQYGAFDESFPYEGVV